MIEDKLDLTYYNGKDLYSDGDVEDELLECVKSKKCVEDELLGGSSWPHLYHLSLIRENVLDWYDFKEGASVLEIGAGCGAITGLLCRKASHVTAIDLSKKRSMINATRNAQYDNLKIIVGNFEDIKLTERFDYITLIGVFEYSIYYINSDNPFMDMLSRVKELLKPDGRLIIAIENKYGLKYFAGAGEDHSGRLFDGIENYVSVDRVRTFSRKTLLEMLTAAGFAETSVYYPMPDYKLPSEVYSDSMQPGFGGIRSACVSYDRDRYELFDERLAYDSICEDGMFGEFANSFITISTCGGNCTAGADAHGRDADGTCAGNAAGATIYTDASYGSGDVACCDKTLYAKYNRLRSAQFQISTIIKESCDGTRYVEKRALRPQANAHIEGLSKNYTLLSRQYEQSGGVFAKVLPVKETKTIKMKTDAAGTDVNAADGADIISAVFSYIDGESLECRVNKTLVKYHTGRDEIIKAVRDALVLIYPDEQEASIRKIIKSFKTTDDFEKIFGNETDNPLYKELKGMPCYAVSNIDSIFSNFVQTPEGELISLDYEWVFDFPIPSDYLKYRTLYYYYSENRAYIEKYIGCQEFLAEFGIDEKLKAIFATMDDKYQQYVHGRDRKYMYTKGYAKKVTNIGKNMQSGEQWFLSIMDDLNVLNESMGPKRRDLVRCNIQMHRKSEFTERWKKRLSNPATSFKNLIKKFH